jgi:nicotinamide riboside transporter PnuC
MIEQALIFITGICAVWLSQDQKSGMRRYACLFGLAGQPFWFYTSYQASQWGIFILSIFYTLAWAKGFYLWWIKKESNIRNDEKE